MKRKIKILDHAFAHCNYSNNPLPPLQESEWIEWDRDLSNLLENELVFFTESNVLNPLVRTHKGKKIAWLLECRYLQPQIYEWIKSNYSLFDHVIGHDSELMESLPNGIWIPFGGCWVHSSDWKIYEKNKLVSIVASEKRYLRGHQMRHQIIDEFRNKIDLFGRGYNSIQHKIESLKDYKYQIVIENESIPGYFTEKLIDCFVIGTVPIYFGDPNIERIFDSNGMIIVNGYDALKEVMENLERFNYSQFREAMQRNHEIAKDYILSEDYIFTKTNLLK